MAKRYTPYKGKTSSMDEFDEYGWVRPARSFTGAPATAAIAATVFKPARKIIDIGEDGINKLLVLAGIPQEKLSVMFRDSIVDSTGTPVIITEVVILQEDATKQVREESYVDELIAYNNLIGRALLVLADTNISVRQRIALKMLMNNFCTCLNPLIKFS